MRAKGWAPGQYIKKHIGGSFVTQAGADWSNAHMLLLDDVWEVYEEQGRDWAWACEQLVAGRKVKDGTGAWPNSFLWIDTTGHMRYTEPGCLSQQFTPTRHHMSSTGWILAEDE